MRSAGIADIGTKSVGEDALVGAQDRIVGVVDVEVHRAVVGVDGDLDAVADVVEIVVPEPGQIEAGRRIEALRVREVIRGRVRVLDVDHPAGVVDDEVGILVEAQERRDQRQAVADRAVEEQLALDRDLVADQQVEVTEAGREQQAHQRVVEPDPRRPGPARLGPDRALAVALAGRVVELVLLGPDDDVRARAFAEVDPRASRVDGRRAARRGRRQVADEEPRLALAADLVDRDHGRPDPVREADPLVDPAGRIRVLLEGELARGEHHLARDAVDHVAVRVDAGEVVVAAHGLELVERRPQRTRSPTAGRWRTCRPRR